MYYTELCNRVINKRKVRWEMDFANRGNRPTQGPQQQSANNNNDQSLPTFKPMKSAKNNSGGRLSFGKLTSVAMLFTATILVLAVVLALAVGGKDNTRKEAGLIQTDKYQAVFINSQDGQVYFGKLGVYNDSLYVLSDIFYVRVENPIQPEGANQPAQPNISLAKLGSELHGPQDIMYIARDKVLYWENLKDDGQVVTAITNFKANGSKPTTPSTTEETTTP